MENERFFSRRNNSLSGNVMKINIPLNPIAFLVQFILELFFLFINLVSTKL
jgi:hypothetical protein